MAEESHSAVTRTLQSELSPARQRLLGVGTTGILLWVAKKGQALEELLRTEESVDLISQQGQKLSCHLRVVGANLL